MPGRKPLYCPEHRAKRVLRRSEQAVRKHTPEDLETYQGAVTYEEQFARKAFQASREAMKAEALALGMSSYPRDLRKAADFAGLFDVPDGELDALAKEARLHHKELIDATPQAVGAYMRRAKLRLAQRLAMTAEGIKPNHVGTAIKAISQAEDDMTASFAEVNITINLPEEKKPK